MTNEREYQCCQVAPEDAGRTVEDYLKTILQISGRGMQKLTRSGGIFVNDTSVYLQKKLRAGDSLRIAIVRDTAPKVALEYGPLHILYEDDALIVLDKPAFRLVHPSGQTAGGTLANDLAGYYEQRGICHAIRPVHRLDRDTTGCVVFAKTAAIQTALEKQLKDKTFRRAYIALAEGCPEPLEGSIDLAIGKDKRSPNRRVVMPNGEPALTHYRTLEAHDGNSLIELLLETGRTHQIRVHLAAIGHPVLGDKMYGRRSPHIARQALHASNVAFTHPITGQSLSIQAPLPDDLHNLIRSTDL